MSKPVIRMINLDFVSGDFPPMQVIEACKARLCDMIGETPFHFNRRAKFSLFCGRRFYRSIRREDDVVMWLKVQESESDDTDYQLVVNDVSIEDCGGPITPESIERRPQSWFKRYSLKELGISKVDVPLQLTLVADDEAWLVPIVADGAGNQIDVLAERLDLSIRIMGVNIDEFLEKDVAA